MGQNQQGGINQERMKSLAYRFLKNQLHTQDEEA